MSSDVPDNVVDKALYRRIRAKVYEEIPQHSAYRSGVLVQRYKAAGGRYRGKKPRGGLTRWFGEEWVDISRTLADGSHPPCGAREGRGASPKCVPRARAAKMSDAQKRAAVRRKRAKGGRGTYARTNPTTDVLVDPIFAAMLRGAPVRLRGRIEAEADAVRDAIASALAAVLDSLSMTDTERPMPMVPTTVAVLEAPPEPMEFDAIADRVVADLERIAEKRTRPPRGGRVSTRTSLSQWGSLFPRLALGDIKIHGTPIGSRGAISRRDRERLFEALEQYADLGLEIRVREQAPSGMPASIEVSIPWTKRELTEAEVFTPMRDHTYFASGSNHPGEIRGFAAAGQDLGIAEPQCGERCLEALEALAGTGVQVFLDSGAFSEVDQEDEDTGKIKKGKPLTPADWTRILGKYERIARALGPNVHVVAPDKVFDQRETLRRMRTYRDQILRIADLGARVIVPLQGGEMSLPEFDRMIGDLYTYPDGRRLDYTVGFPSKKAATSTDAVRDFLRYRKPSRVHFLGLADDTERGRLMKEIVADLSPGTDVYFDSVLIRRGVGRQKGVKPLTAAQDRAELDLAARAYQGQIPEIYDYTDAIGEPSLWLTKRTAAERANRAQLRADIAEWSSADRLALFDSDIDEWAEEASEADALALDEAWNRYAVTAGVARKKAEAIGRAIPTLRSTTIEPSRGAWSRLVPVAEAIPTSEYPGGASANLVRAAVITALRKAAVRPLRANPPINVSPIVDLLESASPPALAAWVNGHRGEVEQVIETEIIEQELWDLFPATSTPVVFLVSCVGEKGERVCPARDLYLSDWFTKARAYVEQTPDAPWFILSAEHGVLASDELVAPYNKDLREMSREERREWFRSKVWPQLLPELERLNPEEIVILAGVKYREDLVPALEAAGYKVTIPMKGLGIGLQKRWLAAQVSGAPQPLDKAASLRTTKSEGADPWAKVRLPGFGLLWTEPVDSEDAFPGAIGSYEVVDGWLVYHGRNGSVGIVVGSPDELRKWASDVNRLLDVAPVKASHLWTPDDGGEKYVEEAVRVAQAVLRALGESGAQIEVWVEDGSSPSGVASGSLLRLSNVHLGPTGRSKSFLGVKIPHYLSVAAHEAAHLGFHRGGRDVIEALREFRKHGGEYLTTYHSLAGDFEGVMEAAAMYALRPDDLLRKAPEVYKAVQDWFGGRPVEIYEPLE